MSEYPRITDAEMHIMDVIWSKGPLGAAAITEKLTSKTQWHRKTVNTLLSRLVKKNALAFESEKAGRQYFALINRDEYMQTVTGRLVENLFGGRLAPLVAHFAESGSLSKDDISELKDIIEELSDERT